MDRFHVNLSLRVCVQKYLEFVYSERKASLSQNESSALKDLSKELQEKVIFETYGRIVNMIPSLVSNFSKPTINRSSTFLQVLHLAPNERVPVPEVAL